MKKLITSFLFLVLALVVNAQIDGNDLARNGYLRQPLETKAGVMVSNNRFSEIYLVKNGGLKTMVSSRGCGLYSKTNKTKDLVGFKSINEDGEQAPAILDVNTGKITLLESYTFQCGQVSFSNDGTIAYTMGEDLIIRKGDQRQRYSLGFYTNLTEISPDATKVAYTNPNGEMFVINLTTGLSSQITSNNMFNPQWSADGTKLSLEKIDGHINVYDFTKSRFFELGEGTEARWANNSEYLVYTYTEKENEFLVHGTSIKKVRFDGTERATLVSDIESCPMSAIVLSDDSLLVPYSLGEKRGLRKIAMDSRLKATSKNSETLLSILANQKIGHTFASFRDKAVKANCDGLKKASLRGGSIGISDIPYINQVWDTPSSHNGCTGYGYVACAPSSSCMLLGYYDLVPKHGVQSRASGVGTVYYSWYVGRDYTSPQTGYTFNTRASGNGCGGVGGGYGYMWGYGSPASTMANFYKNNGVETAYFESSWSAFDREVSNNYPYTICLQNNTSGHVVLGFRTNSQVRNKQVVYLAGSFVCHDPYGDYNGSNYPNWDGRYSTYDWPGYNNGWANINTFYWGCVARHNVVTTSISPAQTSLSFGAVELGSSKNLSVKINASGLSSNISVSCNNSAFKLSTSSIAKTGGTLTVTFKPSEIKSYSGTVTLSSSGASSKTISLSGSGKAAPLSFTEYWNLSEQKGNKTSKGYDASNIRNMAYANGKLYTVYGHNKIKVIKAQTGDDLGDLNEAGVGGGVLKYCDVQTVGNKIVACNLSNGTTPFKVYVWDNDSQNPRVLLETTDLGGVKRMGDCFNVWGDLNNGALYLGHDDGSTTRIFEYKITNGVCSKTPRVFYATTDGTKHLAVGNSCRVIPQSVGYWINGKSTDLTRLDNSGKRTFFVGHEVKWGNAFTAFEYKGASYGLILTFNRPDGVSEHNYTGGRMALLDPTDGWANSNIIGEYPSAGLGNTSRNINGTGNVISKVCNNGNGLEMWVLSTTQGMAYFYTGSCPWDEGVEPIKPVVTTPTIVVSPKSDINFVCGVGNTEQKVLSVSGQNLKGDITVALSGTDADVFTVSPTTIAKGSTQNVTITYSPVKTGSASINHVAKLTFTSQEAEDVVVNLTGKAGDEIVLKPEWVHSAVAGANPNINWMDCATDKARQLVFKGGNLYIVNNDDNGQKNIIIADAYTGKRKGVLKTEGAAPGWFGFTSVENMGGTIVAAGLASGATAVLKVYSWSSDSAAPVEVLSTTEHGGRAGDLMSVSGTINKGKLWFYSEGKFYVYAVTNGKANATPKVIEPKDSKGAPLKAFGTQVAGIYENGTGTFWANGNGIVPMEFKADGTYITEMPSENLGVHGTNFAPIFYSNMTFVALADYKSGLNQGFLSLFKVPTSYDKAERISTYDVLGKEGVANATNLSHVETDVDGTDLHVWILIPKQGAAYYKLADLQSAIEDVEADDSEKCVIAVADKVLNIIGVEAVSTEIYSISGGLMMRRANENLIDVNELSGLYIVVVVDEAGNRHVAKVII